MATRQYIGARYVPKFAKPIEWNNSLSYEGLTIVTHLGNSFTSKKPVPAGIDINNTEYWANTGNYNAQIEEYRQEVETLKNSFENLGIVSVKKYGAKGDGVTDDTTAIQTAINDNACVFFPTGKYHTTSTIKLNDGNRIVGEGRNCVEFIDSFSTGTFQLANNVFIENLNFETDNNADGFALVGNNLFAVNINHVDSLGGYFRNTKSKFIKMTGDWRTLLMNDCIIDCGTETGYAIELISNGDDSLNKDLVMRDVFVDTWYATTGGSIKLDSMFGGTMQNCIVRSKNLALNMIRTIGEGFCLVDADYCKFDSPNENGGIVVAGYCVFYDYKCSYTPKLRFILAGEKVTSKEDGTVTSMYGLNSFTQESAPNIFFKNNNNGTLTIGRTVSAIINTPSIKGISQPIMQGNYNEMCGLCVNGVLNNKHKVGMMLQTNAGEILFFGFKNDDGIKLCVDKYTNANTLNTSLMSISGGYDNEFYLRVNKDNTNLIFSLSYNGWEWTPVHTISILDSTVASITRIGVAVDNETANEEIPYNLNVTVKSWNNLV